MTKEDIIKELQEQAEKDSRLANELKSDVYRGRAIGIRVALKSLEQAEERKPATINKELQDEINKLREELQDAIRQRDQKSEPASGSTE